MWDNQLTVFLISSSTLHPISCFMYYYANVQFVKKEEVVGDINEEDAINIALEYAKIDELDELEVHSQRHAFSTI